MSRYAAALLVLFVLVSGCRRSSESPEAATKPAPQLPNVGPAPVPGLPPDVLVDVDGVRLSAAEADAEVDRRIDAIRNQIPPDRLQQDLPAIRERVRSDVVRQFVDRTLILREADRVKLEVTEADITNAYAQIEATLPKGRTLQDALKDNPLGEERMKEEIRTVVRINKLLEQTLTNDWNVTDAELDAFSQENAGRLERPETVQARHILLQFAPNEDDAGKAAKKAKLDGIRKQLVDGADFAEMAKQHSDCPSGKMGGDLGTFPRGQMVKPFEDAAFSQEVNAIGPIVETTFGYHVIQVLEHKDAGTVPREELLTKLRQQKMQKAAIAFLRDLRAKARIIYGAMPVQAIPQMVPMQPPAAPEPPNP